MTETHDQDSKKKQIQEALSPDTLFSAYCSGYFPMPDEHGQILWYRPDPRAILPLEHFHISKSFRKFLKKTTFQISINQDFLGVMQGCGDHQETWINDDIISAYTQLHRLGAAHSVEVWDHNKLVGGVYGVQFGGCFFAESMFHRKTNASKLALFGLVEHLKKQAFEILEVQFITDHLRSLGAIEIPDYLYMQKLDKGLAKETNF